MADRRKTAHRAAIAALPVSEKEMTDVVVPSTIFVERIGEERAPLGAFAPRTKAGAAFAQLWEETAALLKPITRKRH